MVTFEDVLRQKNKERPYLFNRKVWATFLRIRDVQLDKKAMIRTLELYAEGATQASEDEVHKAYGRFFEERDREEVEQLWRARKLHMDAITA